MDDVKEIERKRLLGRLSKNPGEYEGPPMPWLPQPGKCTRCKVKGIATIGLPSHNSRFCPDCFDVFFLNAVRRGLKKVPLPGDEPIVVAVSGGKDSLTAWDVLHRLGFRTLGIHLDLGIDGFSEASIAAAKTFAESRGLEFHVHSLKEHFGYTVPETYGRSGQEICAVCGTVKRHFLNRLAVDAGSGHLVTGHNLDDEGARLLGNLIRRRERYIEKFHPFLPSEHDRQASRAKPLFRVDETEIRTYVAIHEIRPAQGTGCPFSTGATSTEFKHALNWLETKMPGTKRDFVLGYIRANAAPAEASYNDCEKCGAPTYSNVCAACGLKRRVNEKRALRGEATAD
ncbi:MAG: ATP-binding protein [Desulfatibacillaceae bacterium]